MELVRKNKIQNIKEFIENLPSKVEDIRYSLSIAEIDVLHVKMAITYIMNKYLTNNIKGKAIIEAEQIKMIIDFFIEECSNLQIEEIAIIFKNGVLGRYGAIYNDISIDTICGINGWVEMYYQNDRKKINEPKNEIRINYSGNEMTYNEWLELNPDIKNKIKIKEIEQIIKSNKGTIITVIEYCKMLGHDWEDKKIKLMKEYEKSGCKDVINFNIWCVEYIRNKLKK